MNKPDFANLTRIAVSDYLRALESKRFVPVGQERLPMADINLEDGVHAAAVLDDFGEWLKTEFRLF